MAAAETSEKVNFQLGAIFGARRYDFNLGFYSSRRQVERFSSCT